MLFLRKMTEQDAVVVAHGLDHEQWEEIKRHTFLTTKDELARNTMQKNGSSWAAVNELGTVVGVGGYEFTSPTVISFWGQTTQNATKRDWMQIIRDARALIRIAFEVNNQITDVVVQTSGRNNALRVARKVGFSRETWLSADMKQFRESRSDVIRKEEIARLTKMYGSDAVPENFPGMIGGGLGAKSGDGGAAQKEADRVARVADTRKKIEAAFGNPDDRIKGVETATTDFFTPQLVDQKRVGVRDLGFELARRGLSGGSANVDALAELQRREDKGREQVGTMSINAVDRAKALDEQLKQSLFAQADSGGEAESLVNSALANQLQNANRATNETQTQTLGDIFQNAGLLFRNTEISKGQQDGRNSVLSRLQQTTPFSNTSNQSYYGSVS